MEIFNFRPTTFITSQEAIKHLAAVCEFNDEIYKRLTPTTDDHPKIKPLTKTDRFLVDKHSGPERTDYRLLGSPERGW